MTASVWALPRRADLPRDLAAGFTVALVSVAEGMAYALVAGVDPVYGLYAGSVTVLVGSLFASSTLLVVTATNALALVTAEKIGVLGDGVDPAVAMFTLTLLVGMVMAALGLLRLGSLVRFISAEVQAGLVAAVAILIVLGQYDELVGYASKSSGGKVVKAADISAHVTSWHGVTRRSGSVALLPWSWSSAAAGEPTPTSSPWSSALWPCLDWTCAGSTPSAMWPGSRPDWPPSRPRTCPTSRSCPS